jgi:hypothetical protein
MGLVDVGSRSQQIRVYIHLHNRNATDGSSEGAVQNQLLFGHIVLVGTHVHCVNTQFYWFPVWYLINRLSWIILEHFSMQINNQNGLNQLAEDFFFVYQLF